MRVRRACFFISLAGLCLFASVSMAAPPTHTISGTVATTGGTGVEGVDVVGDNGATATVTAADGTYSITVPNHWDGTVIVSKTGWLITPPSNTYTNVSAAIAGENYTAYQPTISGLVTKADGTPLEGAEVTADSGGGSDTTGASGYYEIAVPYDWSGAVSATLAGYRFTDNSYANVTTYQTNQNFSGYQPTISGSTGMAGATVTISGVGSIVSTPAYSVTVPYGWSGTVEVSLTDHHFPESPRSYTNVTVDQTNQDFTPYQPTISGTVIKEDGTPLEGATVTADSDGGSDTTDAVGYYEFIVPYNWSGIVSATSSGYHFTDKSYANVIVNQPDQNYSGYQPTISGSTALVGATVTISGIGNVISAPEYSVIVPYGWSGTVGVSLTDYGFTESPRSFTNVTTDLTNQDFTPFQPTISGSTGVAGATVTVSGVGSVVSSPNYSVTVPYGWSGTVEVTLADYGFPESPRSYSNVALDQTNQDFTPYQPAISGSTTVAGATVAVSGVGSVTSTPNYSVTIPYDWSGTVEVSLADYHFSDSPRTYTNIITNQTDQNYTPFQPTVSGSTGVAGATVTISGVGTIISTPAYSVIVPYSWSGTIEASLADYHFSESPRSYTNVTVDQTNQNFTAYQPTISGTVVKEDDTPLAGITITADNGGGSDTTDVNGDYEIIVPYDWSGTVNVSRLLWSFTPVSVSYSNVTTDQTGQDYTGTFFGLKGSGTQEDPYLIEDLDDFDTFADSANAAIYWDSDIHTKLMTDIDLSGRTYATAVIAPDTADPFSGVFDGNYHVISNLRIDTAGADKLYLGFFGNITRSVVTNLGLENIVILASSNRVGSLCGINQSSNIENCYSTGTVISSGGYVGGLCGENWGRIENSSSANSVEGGASYVGGLVGYNGITINSCYATGTVISNGSYVGGLCGLAIEVGDITNCYSTAEVTGSSYVGGLLGANQSGLISYCFAVGPVSGDSFGGGLVGSDFSYRGIINCFWDVESTGQPDSAGGKGLNTEQMKSLAIFQNAGWDVGEWVMTDGVDIPHLSWEETGHAPIPPAEPVPLAGSGTEAAPYQVQTAGEFALLSWHASVLDKHIMLTADIDLMGIQLYPIGDLGFFTGILDGGNHSISNATIDLPNNNYVGLFGRIYSSGQIKDIRLNNINIAGHSDVGSLVGYIYDGLINNCCSTGKVVGEEYIGGLIGNNDYSPISHCYSTASVSGSRFVGGLIGWHSEGTLSNSFATGTVSGSDAIGGLVGYNFYTGSHITRCYAAGKVIGSTNAGGLCGDDYKGSISYSYWDVEASGIGTPGSVNYGAIGRTTAQMQAQGTFSNWNFSDIWSICEGTNYPRLVWLIPAGDYLCPDGVALEDYSFFAQHWLQTDYGTVEGAELTGDGFVGFDDLLALSDYWLLLGCGDCDGRDLTGEGNVDLLDLGYMSQRWNTSEYGDCGGAELTGDGIVDIDDFMLFMNNWLMGVK